MLYAAGAKNNGNQLLQEIEIHMLKLIFDNLDSVFYYILLQYISDLDKKIFCAGSRRNSETHQRTFGTFCR